MNASTRLDVSTDDLLRESRDDLLAVHRRLVEVQARFHAGEAMTLDWSVVVDAAVTVAAAAKALCPLDWSVIGDCGPLALPDIAAEPEPRTAPLNVERRA